MSAMSPQEHVDTRLLALATPTLDTARLRLRPFADTDAGPLFALHSSPFVLRYRDAPPWSERSRTEQVHLRLRSAEAGVATVALSDSPVIVRWRDERGPSGPPDDQEKP